MSSTANLSVLIHVIYTQCVIHYRKYNTQLNMCKYVDMYSDGSVGDGEHVIK